jgi:hypothetical protein
LLVNTRIVTIINMNKYASGYFNAMRAALNKWNPLSLTSSMQHAVPKTMMAGGLGNTAYTAVNDFDLVRMGESQEYYKNLLKSLITGGAIGASAPLIIPTAIHAYATPPAVAKAFKALTGEHRLVKNNIEKFLRNKFNMPIQTPPKNPTP